MRRSKSGKLPYSQLERENIDLRQALEDIADILEEVGVLEPSDPDFNAGDEEDDPNVIIVNPEPAGIVEPKE